MTETNGILERDRQRLAFLLRLDGEAFVEAAFRSLLGRSADAAGRATYLTRLTAGARKKTILADLVFSSEARMRGIELRGLAEALRLEYRLRRYPWLLRALDRLAAPSLETLRGSSTVAAQLPAATPFDASRYAEGSLESVDAASLGRPVAGTVSRRAKEPLTIDAIVDGQLFISREDGASPLALVVDGEIRGRVVAPPGSSRVAVALPSEFAGVRPHAFQLVALDADAAASDVAYASSRSIQCACDVFEDTVIEGWCTEVAFERSLSVVIRAGERIVAVGVANIARPDVAHHLGTTFAACGFRFDIPRDTRVDGDVWTITVDGVCDARWELGATAYFEELTQVAVEARRAGASRALRDAAATLERLVGQVGAGRMAYAQRVLEAEANEASSRGREVAVVVPIYSGLAETRECLESLLAAKNKVRSHVVLVNDCSPDPAIVELLQQIDQRGLPHVRVVHRAKNGGFSSTVNIGVACAPGLDVVLLNADTVVGDGWLDRIVASADQDERIGTVTPFSNNAELCTVPAMCVVAPVRSAAVHERLDAVAARVNDGVVVDIPVAHGFCMFIRRACLDDIGDFDAATWGRGYGEEVDFCLKASLRGWRHVLCPSAFVVHRGGVSFGDEKLRRVLENNKKIAERYPFYDAMIQRFLAADPLRLVRQRVSLEVLATELPRPRVLHVVHAFGGGTERYVRDAATLQAAQGFVPFVLHVDARGLATLSVDVPATVLEGFFPERFVETFHASDEGHLLGLLDRLGFASVHVHTALHVSERLLDWCIVQSALRVTVHDYVWCCPRVTLTDGEGRYCGEPDEGGCNTCLSTREVHVAAADLVRKSGHDITRYRARLAPLFAAAEQVFVAGHDVADRLRRHGFSGSFRVVEHPALEAPRPQDSLVTSVGAPRALPRDGAIVVALIGALSDIKGARRLRDVATRAKERGLAMRFVVVGYTARDEELRGVGNVEILGAYEESTLGELVGRVAPHLVFFPNEWPETYSYTLRHAFDLGLWPVVTDIGVPAERVRATCFGTVLPRDSDADACLDRLVEVAQARRGLGAPAPRSTAPRTWSDYVGESAAREASR